MTCDMFGGVNILSKFQLPSSYRLWFMILWRSGGKGSLTDSVNQWINDEAVYRTAPATPGLLKNSQPGWGEILSTLSGFQQAMRLFSACILGMERYYIYRELSLQFDQRTQLLLSKYLGSLLRFDKRPFNGLSSKGLLSNRSGLGATIFQANN